jgi:hypothetical protein
VHVRTPPWIEKSPNGDTIIWSSKAGEGGSAPCRHWVLGLGGCRGHAWLPGWDDETRRDETRRLDRGLRREPGPGYVEFVARAREEKKAHGFLLVLHYTGNARYGSATHVGGGSNACGQKKATGHAICTGYH